MDQLVLFYYFLCAALYFFPFPHRYDHDINLFILQIY